MLKCARRTANSHRGAISRDDREERIWLLDGEPRDEAQGRKMAARDERWPGVHGFFRWMERGVTRLTCVFCSRSIAASSPVPLCGGAKLKPEALNVRVEGNVDRGSRANGGARTAAMARAVCG